MGQTSQPSEFNIARALVVEQGRAALALKGARMGDFEWDLTADTFIISRRAARIIGVPEGSMPAKAGEAFYDFVHPDDRERVRNEVIRGLSRHGRYEIQLRMVRPDTGECTWVETAAAIVRPIKRKVLRIIGTVRDISERQAREDEREALVAELDQRVKNVLASVHALAAQTARRTVSLDAFMRTFNGRLAAMTSAHTLLMTTRWRGALIRHIAEAELGGLTLTQAHWNGPELVLSPKATNALTLALHELGANAVKFGALSSDTGFIDVSWRATPGGGFVLTWVERGGPPVTAPAQSGFGSVLLERVSGRDLEGSVTLDFKSEGVRATIIGGPSSTAVEIAVDSAAPPTDPNIAAPGMMEDADEIEALGENLEQARILIVEESMLLALELEAGLVEAGAKVVGLASSLSEAELLLRLPVDVAVLDSALGGQNCMALASALSARGVPFVYAVGRDDWSPPAGYEAEIVRKPYNLRQITGALARAIAKA